MTSTQIVTTKMSDHDDNHIIDHNGGLVAALRSVWFYYIACTPCRKVGHRRETRKEAKRERGLKARLEMEQPGLYRHPNPENTNEYWMEDINMGPSLPKRGPNSKSQGQGQSQSQGQNQGKFNGAASMPAPDASHLERGPSVSSNVAFPSNETAGSPTVVAADDIDARTTLSMSVVDSMDLEWNHKRYQREDEELWGHQMYNRAGQRLREVITKGRDTAGRLFDTKTGREREITEEERYQFYGAPRNPPVNDYHPPVVSSRPAKKGEFQWMLQPPPPAKVMEGKVPVSRSGSKTSVNSRRTQASRASKEELARFVGEKLVKDKIRNGEKHSQAELTVVTGPRPNSRRTKTASTMSSNPSQRSTRSRSNTTESESSDTIYERRRKRRLARQKAAEGAGSEADDETEGEDQGRPDRRASQRPKLQTIASSELTSKKSDNSENLRPSNLAPMSNPASSASPISSEGLLDVITNTAVQAPAAASPAAEVKTDGNSADASADSGFALA